MTKVFFYPDSTYTLDYSTAENLKSFVLEVDFFTFKKLLIHISSMLSSFIKVLNETQKCQEAKVRYVYLCSSTIELDISRPLTSHKFGECSHSHFSLLKK